MRGFFVDRVCCVGIKAVKLNRIFKYTTVPSIEKRNEDASTHRGAIFALGGATLLAGWIQAKKGRKRAQCCGIVGYIGKDNCYPILMEGIHILQNRGYDSCGITTLKGREMVTTKFASKGNTHDCIEQLEAVGEKRHGGHTVGIAHTRWATHGGKTDMNAHPHQDMHQQLSLIHNGTINNHDALKKDLIEKGYKFKSETDTEVIANLISYHLANGEKSVEQAVRKATEQMSGTWGLIVLHKDFPDRLVLARNGSPLLVGNAEGSVVVASEAAALARHTSQFLALNDGEIATITREGIAKLIESRPLEAIPEERIEVSPKPYGTWMEKEIYEQPVSLARALNYGGRLAASDNRVKLGGLDVQSGKLAAVRHMVLSGCGTSLHAGMYGEQLMQSLKSFDTVRAIEATELSLDNIPKQHVACLFLSQSGETTDVLRACQLADQTHITRLSVVNTVASSLARTTGCGVYLNAGREVAVASTKAFTSQVAVLALVAAWFAQHNPNDRVSSDRLDALMNAIHRLPVYAGRTLQCDEQVKKLAVKLKNARSMFILGKGFGHNVALEAALKIKEVSYIHAEGFPGGSLKHGPFAMIDSEEKTPVILLCFRDQYGDLMLNAIRQVKARGARVIVITDDVEMIPDDCVDEREDVIAIPPNGPLTALLAIIPLQILAWRLAMEKGLNPDKPRGLAKCVTVF